LTSSQLDAIREVIEKHWTLTGQVTPFHMEQTLAKALKDHMVEVKSILNEKLPTPLDDRSRQGGRSPTGQSLTWGLGVSRLPSQYFLNPGWVLWELLYFWFRSSEFGGARIPPLASLTSKDFINHGGVRDREVKLLGDIHGIMSKILPRFSSTQLALLEKGTEQEVRQIALGFKYPVMSVVPGQR
jgi:hypothetical protein